MDSDENNDEADYERDAARSAGVVESLEENERGDNGTGREADIIKRVDAFRFKKSVRIEPKCQNQNLHVG